jgi:hypothetical protein
MFFGGPWVEGCGIAGIGKCKEDYCKNENRLSTGLDSGRSVSRFFQDPPVELEKLI